MIAFYAKNESYSLRLFFQIFSDWSFRKFISSVVFLFRKVSIVIVSGTSSNKTSIWDGQVLFVREF